MASPRYSPGARLGGSFYWFPRTPLSPGLHHRPPPRGPPPPGDAQLPRMGGPDGEAQTGLRPGAWAWGEGTHHPDDGGWARGGQTMGRRPSVSLSLAGVASFPSMAASAWVGGLVRVRLLSCPPRVEEWAPGKARCCVLSGGWGMAAGALGHPPQRLTVVWLGPPGWADSLRLGAGIGLEALLVSLQIELVGGGGGWSGPEPRPPTSADQGRRSQRSLGDMGSPTAGGARGSHRL